MSTTAPEAHPHPEARTYPLMLRTSAYVWWKPALGIVLLFLAFFFASPLLLPLLAVLVALDHDGSFADAFKQAGTLDHVTWQNMLWLNLSLALLVPATWGILRLVHWMRGTWLASVRPGFRWRFFWGCFGLAVLAILASLLVGAFLPGDPADLHASANDVTGRLVGIGVVVLLTTPLQAIGEEYAFRGYLLQAFGSLTRQPWFGIGLSAALFALAHGAQNLPLFLDRLAFGLMAGYVVYRTGGLEAGIALHVWNNLVAFGLALGFGDIDDALGVDKVPWSNIVLTLTQNGVFLVLVLLLARRMGVSRTTQPPGSWPPPPPGEAPVLVPSSPSV
ncbi:MAG: CPBP family intramembrane metalloprotease [Nocardioidaceae bacterium]|nr:CPBP family intramembrane metalloprotease [Nocardioidaceae bacterium]